MHSRDVYVRAHHETASKFVGQNRHAAKYSAAAGLNLARLHFADPVQWRPNGADVFRVKSMKKLVVAILLIASPAWAQVKLLPKSATGRVDNCAPIEKVRASQLQRTAQLSLQGSLLF
jgi:hypothetical protein